MLDQAAAPVTTDDAVRRLLRARIDDAYKLAMFILHDPVAAEDAVQEAALLAWDRRRTLRDSQSADGWFTRILVNVCRDELRRRARRPRFIALDPAAGMGSGPSADHADLAPALRRLTPDEQGLLALRFGRELTVPEIAEQLRVPEGTVKSRLHSTLQHPARRARRRAPFGGGNTMTDDELEQRLRAHYRAIDPRLAPRGLGVRIGDALERRQRRPVFIARTRAAFAAGLAAVVIVAVGLGLGLRPGGFLASPGVSPTPTASPQPSVPSSPGPDRRPGPPAALERVADDPTLHGDAVGAPRLVALPGGTFLMLKAEDVPRGGVLMRSDDGRTWAQVDASASGLDAGAIVDMAANETAVVILGTTEPMTGTGTGVPNVAEWTSADGVTWTRAPDAGALRAIGAREIIGSSRGFAAVGDARLTVLLSGPDGHGWRQTEVPVPQGARGSIGQVAPTADGFLAVGTVEGRSAAWRWDGTGWFRLPLGDTDSISNVVATDGRIIVSGTMETPDPAKPDDPTRTTIAWQSTDGGMTWGSAGLPLDGITDVRVFAMDGGFLAVLSPPDSQDPLSAWRSVRPGAWEPVTLGDGGRGWDRPFVAALALSGRRVVLAGNTVGTGAGGDRVVVWIGDTSAPQPSSSSPSASPSPSPSPSLPLPSGSVPPVSTAPWTGLRLQPLEGGPVSAASVVAWSGGYVALGQTSEQAQLPAWISRDGRSWVALPADTFGPASVAVAAPCADGVVVAVQSMTGQTSVWRSTDGVTWTSSASAQMVLKRDGDLVGNQSGAVAILEGSPYRIAFSADGVTWQTVSLPGSSAFWVQGVAAFGTGFVAVGDAGTAPGSPVAWWSVDGLHWTPADVQAHPGDGFYNVHAGTDGLAAISSTGGTPGRNSFWTSPNGQSWTVSTADPLGVFQTGDAGVGVVGEANGAFTGDGARLLGYGNHASKPTEYWVSLDATHWTKLALAGDTAAAVGTQVAPFLLRDGVLFSGDQGSWFGSAVK